MTKAWPQVPLGAVLRHRKEFVTIDDLANYRRLRVQLHAKGIVQRDEVPGALIKTKKQQVCQAGEFLVAEIDAKVGGFGIVPDALDGAIVSSHYFLFGVDEATLDRRYLDYFIRTPAFREQVEAQGSTNYAAIRPAHVLGYMLPLPPLAEQRRVVARIEELAEQVAEARGLRQRATEEVEALAASVSRQSFGRPNCAVGDVADVTKLAGFEYTKFLAGSPQGDVLLLRAGNVRNNGLDLRNAATIPLEISDQLPRSQLLPFDVVMTFIGARIGDVSSVSPDHPRLHCGPNVAKLTPRPTVDSHYLVAALQAPVVQDQIHEITKLTAQPSLSMKTIRQLLLPVPTLEEQHRIVAELNAVQAQVGLLKRVQAEVAVELNALLPSILDRAFKGELV